MVNRHYGGSHRAFFVDARLLEGIDDVLHVVRSGYGWTDAQIIEHIERYGLEWLFKTTRRIMEDRVSSYRWQLNAAQAGRTPQSKKGATKLQSYVRTLHRALDRMIPWTKERKTERLKRLRGQESDEQALKDSEAMARKLGLTNG